MIILGIDPGLATLGYGILEKNARGVALLTCVKRCGRLFEYTPMQIKQALTGYGKAEKKQIQLVTASLLRLPGIPRPDDAADALAVALCHSFTSRLSGMYTI